MSSESIIVEEQITSYMELMPLEDGASIDLAGAQATAELMQEYRAAIREVTTKFEILDEDARLRLSHNPIHTITSRLKSPSSILEKLQRKGLPLNNESIRANLYDVAGVRVVCNYIDDIETVAQALLCQDDVCLVERKDYVANPKPTGYRSLHLVITVPVFLNCERIEVPVEVQIRTIAMDFWATLEHQLRYKNQPVVEKQSPLMDDIRARLVTCATSITELDQAMQEIQYDIERLCAGEHSTAPRSIEVAVLE